MSNLIDKLKTPSNSLIARLRGSAYIPKTNIIIPPEQEVNLGISNEDFDKQVEQVRGEPEGLVMKAIEAMEDITDKESAKKRAKERLADKTIKETVKGLVNATKDTPFVGGVARDLLTRSLPAQVAGQISAGTKPLEAVKNVGQSVLNRGNLALSGSPAENALKLVESFGVGSLEKVGGKALQAGAKSLAQEAK